MRKRERARERERERERRKECTDNFYLIRMFKIVRIYIITVIALAVLFF